MPEADHRAGVVLGLSRIVKMWFDGCRRAAEEANLDPDPGKIGFSLPVYVAETEEQAHREGRQYIEWLFHKGLKQGNEIVNPPGYVTAGSMRGLLKAGIQAPSTIPYEDLLANGMAIVGSPESVAQRFTELHKDLGFGQLILLMGIGDSPHEHTVKSMELFASQVMPELRSLGSA